MAFSPPKPAEMTRYVRFERRAALNDGGGTHRGGWSVLIAGRWAKVSPTRGGPEVVADRLAGVSAFDVWLWSDPETLGVRPGDRLVDITVAGDERYFTIGFAEPVSDDRAWLLLQVEAVQGVDRSGQ